MKVYLTLVPITKKLETLSLVVDVDEYNDGLVQHQVVIDKFCKEQLFLRRIEHIDDNFELVVIFRDGDIIAIGNIYTKEEDKQDDRNTCEVQPKQVT